MIADIEVENINCNNLLTAKLTPCCICRLLLGITSVLIILSTTLQKHTMTYNHTDPYFTEKLLNLFHVENLNTGANSVEDLYCF